MLIRGYGIDLQVKRESWMSSISLPVPLLEWAVYLPEMPAGVGGGTMQRMRNSRLRGEYLYDSPEKR